MELKCLATFSCWEQIRTVANHAQLHKLAYKIFEVVPTYSAADLKDRHLVIFW